MISAGACRRCEMAPDTGSCWRQKCNAESLFESDAALDRLVRAPKARMPRLCEGREQAMKSKQQAYLAKYQARLEQWEAEIKKRKAKAAEMAADLRLEYVKQTDDLERKIADIRKRMSNVQHASEDAWETMKGGFEAAWADLHSAWEKAKAEFKRPARKSA